MDLVKVVIQNFFSVRNATLYLKNKGLVSIEGDNQDDSSADSNGAGKSTLINAILWCNYGHVGKEEVKADDLVNDKIGKDCMVQCLWEEGTIHYLVSRYRKHTKHKNAIRVEQKHGEGEWKDITKATAPDIQKQLDTILGQDLPTFEANCFARQKFAIDIPAMKDKALKELLEKTLPFDDLGVCFELASKRLTDYKAIVTTKERKISTLKREAEVLKNEGLEAVKTANNYANSIEFNNAQINLSISQKQQAIKVAQLMLVDGKEIRFKIEALNERINSLGDCDLTLANYRVMEAKKKVDGYLAELANPKTSCDSCGQALTDATEHQIHISEKMREADKEFKGLLKYATKVEANHKQANTFETEKNELRALLEKSREAQTSIDHLTSTIGLLEGQRQTVGANPHLATVKRLSETYKALKTQLTELELELVTDKKRLEILEAVAFLYSPKGVRYHILESVTPYLNERTNYYLSQLTDGNIGATWSTVKRIGTGEFREKFSIEIKLRKMTSYGVLSGGQQRKVQLACFLALQDLIASRATKELNIWCADEIDHALDDAGLQRLMVLLDEKTKAKSTILVISHNELREWIPNFATVTLKDEVSTITGYLNG